MAGLDDEALLTLSEYEEIAPMGETENIMLVRNMADARLYVRKFIEVYDLSVYQYLKEHPIAHTPRIFHFFESNTALIVIEEFIAGSSLSEVLQKRCFTETEAVCIGQQLCKILEQMHAVNPPLIHRDIKPSNVILADNGDITLVDMNIAKWYTEEAEDTRLLGTMPYAAPEQAGFGFSASTAKTDIYALAVLLNVILTGEHPKKVKAKEPLWSIILQCMDLDAAKRPTAARLADLLTTVKENYYDRKTDS